MEDPDADFNLLNLEMGEPMLLIAFDVREPYNILKTAKLPWHAEIADSCLPIVNQWSTQYGWVGDQYRFRLIRY